MATPVNNVKTLRPDTSFIKEYSDNLAIHDKVYRRALHMRNDCMALCRDLSHPHAVNIRNKVEDVTRSVMGMYDQEVALSLVNAHIDTNANHLNYTISQKSLSRAIDIFDDAECIAAIEEICGPFRNNLTNAKDLPTIVYEITRTCLAFEKELDARYARKYTGQFGGQNWEI